MESAGSVFFFCFAAFLLLAPLYKAGNRPVPLLLLELAAICILFAVLAVHRAPLALPRPLVIGIALLLGYPLVQLVPLPEGLWRVLPGHAEYAVVRERFAAPAGAWNAISVIPSATEYGWLALLPPLACLLGARRLAPARVVQLLLLMGGLAGAEALLGLLQVGPSGGGILYLGNEEPGQNVAIGTFVNRNHFAAMLAMMLPVIVGLLVFDSYARRHRRGRPAPANPSEVLAQRTVLFASAVTIVACLLFTRSRAGVASGLVGLVCSGILLARARHARIGATRARAASFVVAGLVASGVLVALAVDAGPFRRWLDPAQLHGSADFRGAVYLATLRGAFEFLPLGSGLSTFAGVFPRFQVVDAGGYVDYAHNDYLQAMMELGLVAPVSVALLLIAYVTRMIELLRADGGLGFTLLQIGAGLGLLPMILHSLFDFALHMPSNAMWFAALAGVMFHEGVKVREHAEGDLRSASAVRPESHPTPRRSADPAE